MFDLVVYYHGPQTHWAGKIAEREIIARHPMPWFWLARMRAKSILAELNAGACGCAILKDGEVIEQVEASAPLGSKA